MLSEDDHFPPAKLTEWSQHPGRLNHVPPIPAALCGIIRRLWPDRGKWIGTARLYLTSFSAFTNEPDSVICYRRGSPLSKFITLFQGQTNDWQRMIHTAPRLVCAAPHPVSITKGKGGQARKEISLQLHPPLHFQQTAETTADVSPLCTHRQKWTCQPSHDSPTVKVVKVMGNILD